jgi:hypothetical protein
VHTGRDGHGLVAKQPTPTAVDDFIGNGIHDIFDTLALSQNLAALSSYYGFAAASYADMVRDMVYGNPSFRCPGVYLSTRVKWPPKCILDGPLIGHGMGGGLQSPAPRGSALPFTDQSNLGSSF